MNNSTAHLSFELAVDVCQDESRDLNKCDDEGAFGHSPQMVADAASHGGQNRSCRNLRLVPEVDQM